MNRFKKILFWAGLSVAVLAMAFLLFFAYFTWSTSKQLERRLTELRVEGAPLSIADFARDPIPVETNAAIFLRRADDDVKAVRKECMALYPKSGTPPIRLSEAEIEKLDDLFAAYPKLMPLLERAAACPDYDSRPDASLSPTAFTEPLSERASKFREAIRVLQARSTLLAAKGRFDDALADQILILKLSRLWSREPFLTSYLMTLAGQATAVQGANEILQTGLVSPTSRETLDAELGRLDTPDGLIWALQSERAYSLSTIQEFSENMFWLSGGLRNDLTLRILDFYDQQLIDASRPYWLVEPPESIRRGWNPLGVLVSLLESSMTPAREAPERVRAISRSLRVLNAIQGRGIEEVPVDLDALGLPPDATIDPYNGEPLRVKKLPEGWLVYSVGKDKRDEDGMSGGRRLYGVGPIEEEAKQP